jgi:hypothetical protein
MVGVGKLADEAVDELGRGVEVGRAGLLLGDANALLASSFLSTWRFL